MLNKADQTFSAQMKTGHSWDKRETFSLQEELKREHSSCQKTTPLRSPTSVKDISEQCPEPCSYSWGLDLTEAAVYSVSEGEQG